MTKYLIAGSILLSVLFVGAAFSLSSSGSQEVTNESNVAIENEKQVIEISARGGYSPRVSEAKAGVESVIKMITKGTFDCSSALIIPSLGYERNLPMTGETLIEVPAQKAGTTLQGFCSMGMYSFQVKFL